MINEERDILNPHMHIGPDGPVTDEELEGWEKAADRVRKLDPDGSKSRKIMARIMKRNKKDDKALEKEFRNWHILTNKDTDK